MSIGEEMGGRVWISSTLELELARLPDQLLNSHAHLHRLLRDQTRCVTEKGRLLPNRRFGLPKSACAGPYFSRILNVDVDPAAIANSGIQASRLRKVSGDLLTVGARSLYSRLVLKGPTVTAQH